jgi:tripartite-type tricarboxylate transporter receptor subunit TctC
MQRIGRRTRSTTLCCILMTASVNAAVPVLAGSEDYPNRALKIVVPVPPGPVLDVVPRILAEKLSAKWGKPVIIENRPGAAQNLGAEVVAKAEPDGYTLLATPPGPLVVSGHVYKKLGFDPGAFVPVSVIVKVLPVLVVNPKVPALSFSEFLTYAKANPNKLTYGSPGVGSTPHLAGEQLMRTAGIQFVHVPYQGMAPAMNDLIAGHIDVMIDNLGNVWPQVNDGKLRLLAVTSAARLTQVPDVPAISEALPGFAHVDWFAIMAPPKTPADIATKLSIAIADTLKLPDVAKRLDDYVVVPVGSSPAEAAAFISRESERWRELIDATGIKID